MALGATGTHPWSPWQEQRIIDTPHYRLVEESSSTWRGATTPSATTCTSASGCGPRRRGVRRAAARAGVACGVRELAVGRRPAPAGLHSAHGDLHPDVPALWNPRPLRWLGAYAAYVDFLFRTRSIDEHTEIWWSVRPHLAYGTVEIRSWTRSPAQVSPRRCSRLRPRARRRRRWTTMPAGGLGGAQPPDRGELAGDSPRSRRQADRSRHRYGDSAAAAVERLLEWTADARAELSLDEHLVDLGSLLANGNGPSASAAGRMRAS